MAGKKRWETGTVEHGIVEVRLSSWRYFADYVRQEMLSYQNYVWRGHRNSDWPLRPTLDRLMDKAKIARTKRHEFRREHLEQFEYAARGRRGPNPVAISDENDWWALGQHNGLATPLLDWTTSPFAAAYFAFINTGNPQSRNRVVYALWRYGIESKAKELVAAKEKENADQIAELDKKKSENRLRRAMLNVAARPEIEFIRPKSDENQRLVNQGGLFSRGPDGANLEDWIRANFEVHSEFYVLLKILIPNKDRHEALQMLNRMNMNHLTLFPDMYGASKFCNLYGEIKEY